MAAQWSEEEREECQTLLTLGGTLSGHIIAVRCSLPHPEECEGQAKGCSFGPIKASPGTPNREMDYKKTNPREDRRKASEVVSPVFVEDGQSAPVSDREGVELVKTESMVGEEKDAPQRPQKADCIGVYNSD